jgi:circadian clock protein KaiB
MPKECILRLYILGSNAASELALANLRDIIENETKTIFKLEVIDIRQHPQLAENDKIIAVPTLIRKLPKPIRKIIGDLSDIEKVLLGLDIIS